MPEFADLTIEKGWLGGADVQRLESPNCEARHQDADIELLVIHNISLPPGEFGGGYIEQLFTNTLDITQHPFFVELDGLKVSAHVLIARDGRITQFVPFTAQAWHAGVSCFNGRKSCNDFSIGIELEGTDTLSYTAEQYDMLARVTHLLHEVYPAITRQRIVGHSDIAPERKTDPGESFDWQHYLDSLNF